jgi:hypothetical protein
MPGKADYSLREYVLFFFIADAGSATGAVNSARIAVPYDGDITEIGVSVGAVANVQTALTVSISGTNVTGGVITLLTTGATGDVYRVFPSAARLAREGQFISVVSDSAATNVVSLNGYLKVRR